MSIYKDKDFNAKLYNSVRPDYPNEFYSEVIQFHINSGGDSQLAMDIGTGTGFVANKMLDHFDHVIGTDLSPAMIKQCKDNDHYNDNVEFFVSPGEQPPSTVKENSVDLITAAECFHYFNYSEFYEQNHGILKPNGTLAIWCYTDPVFDDDKATEIFNKYLFDPEYLGQLWPSGRENVGTMYRNVPFPHDKYTLSVRKEFHPQKDSPSSTSLFMEKTSSLMAIKVWMGTWSGYHQWKLNNANEKDITERFVDEIKLTLLWDDDHEVKLIWPTCYMFAKKKEV